MVRQQAHTYYPSGLDAPTTAREQGLQPYGALTLFFRWRKKSVQKKASGTATPEAARPAARYSQISAFRALPCPALVFAQACQSLTAYGSCAHWARAPSRPKLRPAGALRAVLCLGSLCSPAGKKPFIAHFDGGARNVARNGVGQLSPALGARSCSPFSAVKMSGPFSLRCLSPLVSPAGGVGQTQMAMFGTFLCSLDISAAQKTSVNIESRWPFLFNEHEVTPDRRAARPVAERR